MRQLKPGTCKDIFKVRLIVAEFLSDLAVFRIDLQRHIGICHHRHATDRRIFHIHWHVFFGDVHRLVLVSTGWAFGQFPVVLEQQIKVTAVPLRWVGGPGTFNATRYRIATNATGLVVLPAEALLFDVSTFRRWAKIRCVTVTVCFTDRVTTCCKSYGFLVVHGHTLERDAHVFGGFQWIRITIHALWVDVNQAHHDSGEWVFHFAVARGVVTCAFATAWCQPLFLRTPVGVFFWVPDVFTTTGKTEGFKAHGFVRHVTGENHQVSPGQLVAVFLFDRPQQTTRLIQVAVIRPAVQRCEALVAGV